jgi:hypothetical protein
MTIVRVFVNISPSLKGATFFGRKTFGRRVSFYTVFVGKMSIGQMIFDQKAWHHLEDKPDPLLQIALDFTIVS